MLIAQITDIHIGFDQGNPEEDNVRRLRAVVARLVDGPNRPGLVLLSGDLTEFGDTASYARLLELIAPLDMPLRVMTGNHDERAPLLAAFPDTPTHDGFVQFVEDLGGLRLIAIDTLESGRHGGGFCEVRAAWLAERLADAPDAPTLIAMHHPPIVSGLHWLDGGADEPWIVRFRDAIAGHGQVQAIVSGHLHRTIHTRFAGVPLTVVPSTAATVALDLNVSDPNLPDGRPTITAEPPGYALHRWDGAQLFTHFESVPVEGEWPILARYDAAFQPVVQLIAEERGG